MLRHSILAYFSSRCGCTVAQLKKREYAPGESGTIKATYSAPRAATTVRVNSIAYLFS